MNLFDRMKSLKTKLGQWGFGKNVKKDEVIKMIRDKVREQERGTTGEYALSLMQRPILLQQIERHIRRAGLQDVEHDSLLGLRWNPALEKMSQMTMQSPFNPWRALEKVLYDIDILVRKSFETGQWIFNGNNLMIKSSGSQGLEKQALHDFLADFAIGCHAAGAKNFLAAGNAWKRAFLNVETLVKGNYYDIIPNIVQKINDLNRQGYDRLAALLKEHISHCGKVLLPVGTSTRAVFDAIGQLDMDFMLDIEDRIMSQYYMLFEFYLGSFCYSSFVMMMDGARRRLLLDPRTDFSCLPNISQLDTILGPTNRRSLDVIFLRIEILHHRGLHTETEIEASKLVQRAKMIRDDDWQRHYNLTRGWYFLGSAQYFLKKRKLAIESLSNALIFDDELCKIDEFHIFDTERMVILKYLVHLRSNHWVDENFPSSGEYLKQSVGSLVFFRCCKEPMRLNVATST